MEWLIAFLMVLPAVALAMTRSSGLLDYAIIVLAFNRGVRRMVDYYFNGAFNPFSPISLTPLIVAGLLFIPVFLNSRQLQGRPRLVFRLLGTAILIGFSVGVIINRFAAVYSLAEWLSGLAAMAFAATQSSSSETADRWIKTAGWSAVGVAIYGWWQYFTIPPWDAMWLVQSGMEGYMGEPEPTQMTVFSTLNERGPCGGFMAWAVIPMILSPRWRNIGSWASVALLISGIFLTTTRSNLVLIAMVAILFTSLSKGRGTLTLVLLSLLVFEGANYMIARLPGGERIGERFQSESLYGEDSSLQGRLQIYSYSFSFVLQHPLGLGLGSSGLGKKTEKREIVTVGDSGYVQILAQFGWLGSALFFAAFAVLWREAGLRNKVAALLFGAENVDPFILVAQALVLGALGFLFVGDIFSGFSLVWIFFGRILNPGLSPAFLAHQQQLVKARAYALLAKSISSSEPAPA